MIITDNDRAKFLESYGYLPINKTMWAHLKSSDLVEWAIDNRFCPAYWRAPKNLDEELLCYPPKGNGMILVKAGDRNRIDQIILQRL